MLKKLVIIAVIALAAFVVLQFLPIGKVEANPPVVQEPKWDSSATRTLAVRACFDCHSSETRWPWYSRIAPASWMLGMDVARARAVFSFSDWKSGDTSPERAARVVREHQMPPSRYLMLHPEARLTDAELEQLAEGLLKTLK